MASAKLPRFDLGDALLQASPSIGWGPASAGPAGAAPSLGPLPFLSRASVQRGAIGHAADWTDTSRNRRRVDASLVDEDDEDDARFQTVTSQNASSVVRFAHHKRWKQRGRQRDTRNRQKDTRSANEVKGLRRFGENTRERRTKRNSRRPNFQRKKWWTEAPKVRPDSIPPSESWESVKDVQFIDFAKLDPAHVSIEELYACGSVYAYDGNLDAVTCRAAKALVEQPLEAVPMPTPSTADDPKMKEFIDAKAADVFATDQLLSFLITAGRSEYSWDLVVDKLDDGRLVFNRRPAARLDTLYVWEGSYNRPEAEDPADLQNPRMLSAESTRVNYAFQRQAVPRSGKTHDLGNPALPSQPNGTGYVYRKFTMPSGKSVIVRGSVDAFEKKTSGIKLLKVCSVNEYQPTERFQGLYDWATKLDSQKAAMWLTEVRNNSAKLGRWVCQSLLSNIDGMKVGFITRKDAVSTQRHRILATQKVQRAKLAHTISFEFAGMWAVVEHFVRILSDDRLTPGKYIIVKDANRPLLKISKVPVDAFDKERFGQPLDYDVGVPMGEMG